MYSLITFLISTSIYWTDKLVKHVNWSY